MNNAYLDGALQAEGFLASLKIDTEDGLAWKRTTAEKSGIVRTLYHGSSGIALFYIELYRATEEPKYIETAIAAGKDICAYVARQDNLTIGLYSGWPGYVTALTHLADAALQYGDKTSGNLFRDTASHALHKIHQQSSSLGSGIGWIEPAPFGDITGITDEREVIDLDVGAAGAGLTFLFGYRAGLDDHALSWAKQTAERLLEVAEQTPDGLRWFMMSDMPFPFTTPNFSHGGAGVGYFLADLYRETKDQRYLDAAISAARYVQSRSVPAGDGHLVCHNEEQQPPTLFYLGLCHGPTGTGRLMYLLAEITGDNEWMDWIGGNVAGLESTGAPQVRSKGLWQNFGQCCGDAGIGDYLLYLHRVTSKPDYLELAKSFGSGVLEQGQTSGAALSWPQAEHRTRPDFIETQSGYMQGAAGLGSFLLHLANPTRTDVKVILSDNPFTR